MPVNHYKPSAQPTLEESNIKTPAEEYDLNFVFPVPEHFESKGVKLVPLVPSAHSETLFNLFLKYPVMLKYLPYSMTTLDEYYVFLEGRRREPGTMLWVVYDQSLVFDPKPAHVDDSEREERIAGVVGVLKCNDEHRWGEVGHLNVLPPFHRSHITTHSCALLIQYLFDTLSLRRVCWFAHSGNTPSINAGLRLGLKHEALLKWDRVLTLDKEDGYEIDGVVADQKEVETKAGRGKGRHSVILGLGWDDWRESGRRHLQSLLDREIKPRTLQDLVKA